MGGLRLTASHPLPLHREPVRRRTGVGVLRDPPAPPPRRVRRHDRQRRPARHLTRLGRRRGRARSALEATGSAPRRSSASPSRSCSSSLSFGYFLPYGGVSPGPRFFIPAVPFLAVGLAPAFARIPIATCAVDRRVGGRDDGDHVHLGSRPPLPRNRSGASSCAYPHNSVDRDSPDHLPKTPLAWVIPNRLVATPIVALLALTALALALMDGSPGEPPSPT